MKSHSVIKSHDLSANQAITAALENERKQQREETLEWISVSALSKLRLVWGN